MVYEASILDNLNQFLMYKGFANVTLAHIVMILVGLVFIYLAITKDWEPMLLIPIGFGILIGNIPLFPGLNVGVYEQGSVLNIFYGGVSQGWYPPLIFLGIGAMTDFSALISNPKLMLIGAAAQFGIFGAYIVALALGFSPTEAGAIGIIGGADGPTAIFLSSKLAPNLMGAIAVSAYSYMALVPVIQRPIMLMLTTKKERLIRMKNTSRKVTKLTKITLPLLKGVIRTTITFWSINATTFFLWTKMFSSINTEGSTIVPVVYLYDTVFGGTGIVERDAGAGAAVGVVLTLIIIAIYVVMNTLLKDIDLEY